MFTSRVARAVVQKRSLSTIAQKRAKFYSNPAVGAENPTYLKESGDKVFVTVAFVGVGIGLTVIGRGLYSMMLGVNKVK